ncbi:11216_t:CDS:2, partial [Scutellospora calospora]
MPLGTAKQVNNLEELLKQSDFVTIHVSETNKTKNLISEREIYKMKKGSYLINTFWSTIVQISVILKGYVIDMLSDDINEYNNDGLRTCKNLILTPHISKLTEEAQKLIGVEVATAIFKYINLKLSM